MISFTATRLKSWGFSGHLETDTTNRYKGLVVVILSGLLLGVAACVLVSYFVMTKF